MKSYKNNIYLSICMISLILGFLGLFFLHEGFFQWAFERHQNTLSWWIRPVMIIPFCYFAYTRNLNLMLASILALLTSMFWFPVPSQIHPDVVTFLEMEKAYLKGEWNIAQWSGAILIIAYFSLLGKALWEHSIKLGALVILSGMLGKIFWSILHSPEAGTSIIPYALAGTLLSIVCIVAYWYYQKKSSKK